MNIVTQLHSYIGIIYILLSGLPLTAIPLNHKYCIGGGGGGQVVKSQFNEKL